MEYIKNVPEFTAWEKPIGKFIANAATLELETLRWLINLQQRSTNISEIARIPFDRRVSAIRKGVGARGYSEAWKKAAEETWHEAEQLIAIRDRLARNPVVGRYEQGQTKPTELFIPDVAGGSDTPAELTLASLGKDIDLAVSTAERLAQLRKAWCWIRDAGPTFPRLGRLGNKLERIARREKGISLEGEPVADAARKAAPPPADPRPETLGSDREFTVVMRGPAAVVFKQGDELLINSFPAANGLVTIKYRSRWIPIDGTGRIPGQLWVEVRGPAKSLEEALEAFANAGLSSTSIIATAANAAVGECDVDVGFDSTQGFGDRDFFQSHLPSERPGVIHPGREVDPHSTLALVRAIWESPHQERLLRACAQYSLALRDWKHGHSTIALAHLWMAVEALTPVRACAERLKRGLQTNKQLADALNVKITDLDPTVRQQFILRGDAAVYASGKKASDGFEHGFLSFSDIFDLSSKIRIAMAKYVRLEILELSDLPAEARTVLEGERFAEPLGHWPHAKYLRGTLNGSRESLARSDNEYPIVRWSTRISKCEMTEEGKFRFETKDTFNPELGPGATFTSRSIEIWRAG